MINEYLAIILYSAYSALHTFFIRPNTEYNIWLMLFKFLLDGQILTICPSSRIFVIRLIKLAEYSAIADDSKYDKKYKCI